MAGLVGLDGIKIGGSDDEEVNNTLTRLRKDLNYLLTHLDTDTFITNITQNTPEGILPDPVIDDNPPLDQYGIDTGYIKFHSNKCHNSGFENLSSTGRPFFWVTDGVVSEDSNFDDTVALCLSSGQYAVQTTEPGVGGLWDPSWWSTWCNKTRISFRVKGGSSDCKVKAEVLNASSQAQSISYWTYSTIGWVETTAATYLETIAGSNWSVARRSFDSLATSSGRYRVKFTNTGTGSVYIDAVTVEPDYTGRWPSFYTAGPRSQQSHRYFIQTTAPSNPLLNDIWFPST